MSPTTTPVNFINLATGELTELRDLTAAQKRAIKTAVTDGTRLGRITCSARVGSQLDAMGLARTSVLGTCEFLTDIGWRLHHALTSKEA